jgi:metal-responsive CopG/Arc/MetJ family transcriptional regulator
VVKNRVAAMKTNRISGKDAEVRTVRASISFPADVYTELERIADEKKVSLAWVVRDAVEQYVRTASEKPARKG